MAVGKTAVGVAVAAGKVKAVAVTVTGSAVNVAGIGVCVATGTTGVDVGKSVGAVVGTEVAAKVGAGETTPIYCMAPISYKGPRALPEKSFDMPSETAPAIAGELPLKR